MKRLLTLAAMFLCCVATSFAQFSGSGSGTENDPYLILNPIHLNQLRNYLNQEGVYFKMMANVDLTEYLEDESPTQGWQPVGSSSSAAFKGILDGNGKTISGLWINRPNADYVGFFGYTVKATIKNVTIVANNIVGKDNVGALSGYGDNSTYTGVNFTTTKIQGASNVGGLAGNTGDNMTLSDNTVATVIIATGYNVGGLIGKNDAGNNLSVSDCQVNDSKITGNDNVGGAIGGNIGTYYTSNALTSCYIHADITGNQRVGGICGYCESGGRAINLTNCGFIGNIDGSAYIGGLIGFCKNGGSIFTSHTNIRNGCFAVGSISGTSDYVGGLLGYDSGNYYYYYKSGSYYRYQDISNCYFSGSVVGRNYTGGLVGYKGNYGTISNSYCSASVLGNQYVGGLVGYQEGNTTLKTSVAINTRVYATEGDVNRIVGYSKGTIAAVGSAEENKSYNRTIIVSQGVAKDIEDDLMNGTGVSLTTLKLKATFVAMGWDFTDTWAIQETECHPYMKAQTAPPVITSSVKSGATVVSGKCVDGGTITLEIDGVKQQMVSSGNNFSFNVSPLQAGHEVRVSAKAEGKEQSYYTTELVTFLGKGTEADPYQVYTAADLTCVYRRGYYKQMKDIDLAEYINQFSPTEGWQSIGRDGSETIHYDGDGHKITGLWCNSTRDNTGLFSCFANGEIKNLTVETAEGKQVKGGANTGIIIGKMINGSIVNCHVSGTVSDGTPVGGIVGLMDGGTLSKCQGTVTINCEGANAFIGGLVGELNGEMQQCLSRGTLTCTGATANIGGLVGLNQANSTIANSYSTALVNSSYCVAGIVAYNYGLVDKCYASGNMFSQNYGAGIIGYNDGASAIVQNCVALNKKLDVKYESQQNQQSGGYGQRIIGGIKNGAPAPEMNNYALKTMQVSVNDVAQKVYDDIMNGTAKSGLDLMTKATYEELGWDFTNTWKIEEGSSYPYLVTNEGGSDNPDEPDPQPTTEDKLSVETITMRAGATATVDILLNNQATDYTAYQFDLTLPTGFSIAKNPKGKWIVSKGDRYEDETQQLTVELLDAATNTYRFISFSMSNGIIEGTEGSILSLELQAAENVEDGEYEGRIKNINFTSADGHGNTLSDATFKIKINSVILGDANGDGIVNVTDIVETVNYILNKPSAAFILAAADVNQDGTVNVTDIVCMVTIIMSAGSNEAPQLEMNRTAYDVLSLNSEQGGQTLSLCLNNENCFVASQFDIRLSEGQQIKTITLNKERSNGHVLTWSMTDENTCRVVVYSLSNNNFLANDGELLKIELAGNSGLVVVDDITFVTSAMKAKTFDALVSETTGISDVRGKKDDVKYEYFNLNGQRVAQPVKNGLYIVNGQKCVIR